MLHHKRFYQEPFCVYCHTFPTTSLYLFIDEEIRGITNKDLGRKNIKLP